MYYTAQNKANGLQCIGVLWGIGSENELRTARADSIAATPAALVPLLAA